MNTNTKEKNQKDKPKTTNKTFNKSIWKEKTKI